MKKFIMTMVIFTVMVVLVACSGDKEEVETPEEDVAQETTSEESSTIEVTHELDSESVTVPKNPKNVIVFDFGVLDTLHELDVEVAGLPKANMPKYLEKYTDEQYENLGSMKEPDFEAIHALKPEVIFISTRQADLYDQFKDIAPTIYVGLDYDNYMDSFKHNMNLIGEVFEKEDEVTEKLAEIDESIIEINEQATETDEKALILLASEGKISAYGPSSRFGLIHDVFGFGAADEGIEVSTHGQNITSEYILEKNPDVIFAIDRDAAIGAESSAKATVENDLVQKTNAFQNDNVYYLDGEYWYLSGGGLLSMKEMVKEVGAVLE